MATSYDYPYGLNPTGSDPTIYYPTGSGPTSSQSTGIDLAVFDTLGDELSQQFGVLPVDLRWNITLTVGYVIVGILVFIALTNSVWRSTHFSSAPWIALLLAAVMYVEEKPAVGVRYVEAVLGFNLRGIGATDSTMETFEHFDFVLTFFWDVGLFFIILGIINAACLSLPPPYGRKLRPYRSIWAFLVICLLIAGNIMSSFAYILLLEAISPQRFLPAVRPIQGTTIILETVTVFALVVPFAWTIIHCRPGKPLASSPAFASAIAFFPTLVILPIRLVPDTLRMWQYHYPSFVQLVATGLMPELLVIAIWSVLGIFISRWETRRRKERKDVVERARHRWLTGILNAFVLVAPFESQTKAEMLRIAERNRNTPLTFAVFDGARIVLGGAMTRAITALEVGPGRLPPEKYLILIKFLEEIYMELGRKALVIAERIAMVSCEDHSLFGAQPRPISYALTVAAVRRRLISMGIGANVASNMANALTAFYLADIDIEVLHDDDRATGDASTANTDDTNQLPENFAWKVNPDNQATLNCYLQEAREARKKNQRAREKV